MAYREVNMSDSKVTTQPGRSYVLGHSDRELARLQVQARLIGPITRGFMRDSGIAPGMRVLDVGSGAGDVAFIAAEIVGLYGEVLGVDRDAAAIDTARQRAIAVGASNVTFRRWGGDPRMGVKLHSTFIAAGLPAPTMRLESVIGG